MKTTGNCRGWDDSGNYRRCPYLLDPMYHAGYTGKSGIEASYRCRRFPGVAVTSLSTCPLAGDYDKQWLQWDYDCHKGTVPE